MPNQWEFYIQNPYNSAGQATINGFLNNLPYENVTIEELQQTITSSADAVREF